MDLFWVQKLQMHTTQKQNKIEYNKLTCTQLSSHTMQDFTPNIIIILFHDLILNMKFKIVGVGTVYA